MKHFCGARKLYVRLYICKDVISGSFSDDSDITSLPLMLPPNNNNNNNNNYCRSQVCSTSTAHSVAVVDEIPSTPSGVSLFDEYISSLTVLLPEAKLSEIREKLIQCGSLELAAAKLSEEADSAFTCAQSHTSKNASGILKQLNLKMKGYTLAEKITFDREDLVLDLFQYYKDPDFNPQLQIKIQFRREPAIDKGSHFVKPLRYFLWYRP